MIEFGKEKERKLLVEKNGKGVREKNECVF